MKRMLVILGIFALLAAGTSLAAASKSPYSAKRCSVLVQKGAGTVPYNGQVITLAPSEYLIACKS